MSKKKKISRKDFIKLSGIASGTLGAALLSPSPAKKLNLFKKDGYTYRDRSDRYPGWVRTVDEITTEFDLAKTEKATKSAPMFLSKENMAEAKEEGKKYRIRGIKEEIPGETLADVALFEATGQIQGYMLPFGRYGNHQWPTENVLTPEELGVDRWSGSEEEAADKLDAVARAFGAHQVGFSALEPKWLKNAVLDPNVKGVKKSEDGPTRIPESYKYVATLLLHAPPELSKRAPSALGSAADRSTYMRLYMARVGMINFITTMGYEAMVLPGLDVPHAIRAGLGELGRVNRMISPIYGGNVRLTSVLTNMPVALDKPIDFGLQEFCKHCKKCAEACPAGAISTADEPTWEPQGEWQVPGTKAYYEDSPACYEYWLRHDTLCASCMVACPWSKQDKTALHDVIGFTGATAPGISKLLTSLDDSFGYGVIKMASPEMENWWKYDLPPFEYDA